jgi:hypothetical protein
MKEDVPMQFVCAARGFKEATVFLPSLARQNCGVAAPCLRALECFSFTRGAFQCLNCLLLPAPCRLD